MKTGLFFGSFNPVHIGHMAIANYFAAFADCREIWFIVSPQNPLKKKASLLDNYQRLELVEMAIGDDPRFRASNIEFQMPVPSFTSDTLAYLKERYPRHQFVLILGADNLASFSLWKNHEKILENNQLYVYPRPGITAHPLMEHPSVSLFEAPLMEISSSFLRDSLKKGRDLRHFFPPKVYDQIITMNYYRK